MPIGLLLSEEGFLAISDIGFKFCGINLYNVTFRLSNTL